MFICEKGDEFIPRRGTLHSAGYDFFATEDINIKAGEWVFVDTHVKFEPGSVPPNKVLLVFPRSSTGFKYGLRLRNTVGIIDADFPDTIKAVLTADVDLEIKKGHKFMQGILVSYDAFPDEIPPTDKRVGGIGSTGQ